MAGTFKQIDAASASRDGSNEQQGRTTRLVGSGGDIVKYALALLLVAAGVFAYIYFEPVGRADARAGRGRVAWWRARSCS